MEGKIVVITDSNTVPKDFLGRYGLVIKKAYDDKWTVEFNKRVKGIGYLRHTVSEKDFEVVGVISKNES